MANRCAIPDDTRVPRFYILPNIHKPGNPSRPILSSCGSLNEGISHFVEFHLGPLVKKIPSYIKATTDFLNKIRNLRKSAITNDPGNL